METNESHRNNKAVNSSQKLKQRTPSSSAVLNDFVRNRVIPPPLPRKPRQLKHSYIHMGRSSSVAGPPDDLTLNVDIHYLNNASDIDKLTHVTPPTSNLLQNLFKPEQNSDLNLKQYETNA